jgi:two-component system, LytTR family, sensor kinase
MKKSTIIIIHLLFWTIASIIPLMLLLVYSTDMSRGMILYQTFTQFYYIIVFYFIYIFIEPVTIGSSKKLTAVILIYGASIVFFYLLKIGNVILIDSLFSFNLRESGIYSPEHYASDMLYIIFYSAFAVFIKFTLRWFEKRKANTDKLLQEHKFELELLKAQINPHFFFNTLNNIYSLVYKKSDEAPAALMKLSDIMRYMLYESKAELVPLNIELEHLVSFIELQKLRFKDPEFIDFNISGNTSQHDIPPMLLISFVENACKHGRKKVENPGIVIRIEADNNNLVFSVKNFIQENEQILHSGGNGIGLQNTRRRLELIYPGCHNLTIMKDRNIYDVKLEINCNQN